MKKLLAAIFAGSLLASSVQAVTVNVNFANGTVNNTTALAGFQTDGDAMSGMSITAYFANNTQQTVAWGTTGANAGAAIGSVGWSLAMSGDTFTSPWSLANSGNALLTRLLIDAGPGNTVFDTTFGGLDGTVGSASGTTFAVNSISAADQNDTITATYRDIVSVGLNAPVGDLFRVLDIVFNDGLSSGSVLRYVSDTDNLKFAGDIRTVPEAMSTIFGLGAALSGLLVVARRRVK